MEIYLLRHGIAEDPRSGMKDADRALVPEGKKRLKEVLQVAKAADVKPGLILTSPYRRAVETARIAADVLQYQDDVVTCASLTPMASPGEAWAEIRLHKDSPSILLASHEPLTGLLIGFLLGAPSMNVDVKKGSLTRIDVDTFGAQPRGVLKWMLTPKLTAR